MDKFETIQFQNCHVRYFQKAEYLETVFADGKVCPALFTFLPSDILKAAQMGYSATTEGVRRLHYEHELSHTFLAEALGEPYCPVLRSVAVKGPCEGAWEREAMVLAFQRWLNGTEGWHSMRELFPKVNGHPFPIYLGAEEFCRRFRK